MSRPALDVKTKRKAIQFARRVIATEFDQAAIDRLKSSRNHLLIASRVLERHHRRMGRVSPAQALYRSGGAET